MRAAALLAALALLLPAAHAQEARITCADGDKACGIQKLRAHPASLERTDFATLYSATHPGDDFAEAFANYVHVALMRKPFTITIREDGRAVKTYRACWEQARCAAKRRLIEELLR